MVGLSCSDLPLPALTLGAPVAQAPDKRDAHTAPPVGADADSPACTAPGAPAPAADKRAIALLVACRLVATLANTSCFTVGLLGTAVYDLGASVFQVSLLMLVVNLAIVVGNALGGLAVDAFGPRKVLVAGLMGYTLTGVVFFLMPLSLAALTALSGLYSLVFGAVLTVFTSLPPFVVSDASLPRANSLMATAENAAYIVGPALGGAVALAWSAPGCFAVLAVGGLVAVPFALALPAGADGVRAEKGLSQLAGELSGGGVRDGQGRDEVEAPYVLDGGCGPETVRAERGATAEVVGGATVPAGADEAAAPSRPRPHGLAYALQGFRLAFSTPALACLVPLAFLAFFSFGAFDSLETVFYRDVLKVGVEWTGWLNAVMGVGATVGSLALLRVPERRQTVSMAAWLTALVGAGTVLYVGTASPWVAAVGMAVLGFGWGLFEPLLNLVVQRDAPEGAVGRVMGVLQMGQRSSGVLPLLAAPFLAQVFGVQPVLVAAGLVAVVVGLAFVPAARKAGR